MAGVPDDVPGQRAQSAVVRRLKSASVTQLADPPRGDRPRARRDHRARVLERRRLRQRRDDRRRPAGHRGGRRLRAAGARAVRPLPQLRAAAGRVLRPPGRTTPRRRRRHRRRRWLHRERTDRQGPLPAPLGAAGPAPDRARGRRRGADAADRPRTRPAAGRRLGVVPARQVRRDRRAHQHRAPAGRRRDRRLGAVLPRVSAWPGESGRRRRRAARSGGPRPWATGGWCASTDRRGPGKSTLAAVVRGFDRLNQRESPSRLVHMDDLVEGWGGLSGVDAQLDGILRPLADGRPGELPPLRLARRRLRRDRHRRARARCSSSRASAVVRPASTTSAPLLVWVEAPYDERLRRGTRARRRRVRAALGAVGA